MMSEPIQTPRSIKREYWHNHIDNWLSSGLSQTKYCEQENISFASFSWWRTKGLKGKTKAKKLYFVPAVIKEPETAVSNLHINIELIFPNQTKLVLPSNLPVTNLVSIVKSLGGLS
jgi:hypothetical protein